MVDARYDTLVDGSKNGHSEVTGVGRRAYLVKNDTQFRFLLAQTNHRLDEVVSKSGVKPCGADNHRILTSVLYGLLAGQLGATIDTVGTDGISLNVRCVVSAVEHVVGGDLNHPTATLLYGCGQIARSHMVQQVAQFRILLGLVDSGVGGTIDDAVDAVLLDIRLYGLLVRDVQLSNICVKIGVLGAQFLQQLHLVS